VGAEAEQVERTPKKDLVMGPIEVVCPTGESRRPPECGSGFNRSSCCGCHFPQGVGQVSDVFFVHGDSVARIHPPTCTRFDAVTSLNSATIAAPHEAVRRG
jgi:hypothetical protein